MGEPKTEHDWRNNTFTKDELSNIGSIAIESATCDHITEGLIWSLAGMNREQGIFFTNMMPLDKKLDLLRDLAKQQFTQEQLDDIGPTISTLKELNSKRNIAIHGSWIASSDFFDFVRDEVKQEMADRGLWNSYATAVKRRLRSDPVHLPSLELETLAKDIALNTAKLWGLFGFRRG